MHPDHDLPAGLPPEHAGRWRAARAGIDLLLSEAHELKRGMGVLVIGGEDPELALDLAEDAATKPIACALDGVTGPCPVTALLFADEAALLRALDIVFVNGANMVRPFFENRRPEVLAAGAYPCVIGLPDGLCIEWVVRESGGRQPQARRFSS